VLGTPAVRTSAFVGDDDMSNFRELETEYGLLQSFADEDAAIDRAVAFLKEPPREAWARGHRATRRAGRIVPDRCGIHAPTLRRSFPDGTVRPVVCRCEGEFAGGKILLELGDQAIDWISVADRDVDIPVTDLVDWWYITNAVDRGIESYDLAGANNPRLSRYKKQVRAGSGDVLPDGTGILADDGGDEALRKIPVRPVAVRLDRPNRCHATIGDCAISPLARPSALRSH